MKITKRQIMHLVEKSVLSLTEQSSSADDDAEILLDDFDSFLSSLPPAAAAALDDNDQPAFEAALLEAGVDAEQVLSDLDSYMEDFVQSMEDQMENLDDALEPLEAAVTPKEPAASQAPARSKPKRRGRRRLSRRSRGNAPPPDMVKVMHVVSDFGADNDGDWAFVVSHPDQEDRFFDATGDFPAGEPRVEMYRNGEKYRSLVNHGGGHWGEVMLDPDAKLFRIYYDSGDYVDLEYNPVGDPKTLKEQAPGFTLAASTTLSAIQAKIEQIKADQDKIADAIEKYERLESFLKAAIDSSDLRESAQDVTSITRGQVREMVRQLVEVSLGEDSADIKGS